MRGSSAFCQKKSIDPAEADQYGKDFLKALATSAGVEYDHIGSDKMRRSDFHDARICYYVAKGAFDPSQGKLLPGFVVNKEINPEGAKNDVNLAFQIALGNHGFGGLITEKDPFAVVIVARSKEELEELQSEIKELVKDNKKIIIRGFII